MVYVARITTGSEKKNIKKKIKLPKSDDEIFQLRDVLIYESYILFKQKEHKLSLWMPNINETNKTQTIDSFDDVIDFSESLKNLNKTDKGNITKIIEVKNLENIIWIFYILKPSKDIKDQLYIAKFRLVERKGNDVDRKNKFELDHIENYFADFTWNDQYVIPYFSGKSDFIIMDKGRLNLINLGGIEDKVTIVKEKFGCTLGNNQAKYKINTKEIEFYDKGDNRILVPYVQSDESKKKGEAGIYSKFEVYGDWKGIKSPNSWCFLNNDKLNIKFSSMKDSILILGAFDKSGQFSIIVKRITETGMLFVKANEELQKKKIRIIANNNVSNLNSNYKYGHIDFKFKLMKTVFSDYSINLAFDNIEAMEGSWNEIPAFKNSFQGNAPTIDLSIEKKDYKRILQTEIINVNFNSSQLKQLEEKKIQLNKQLDFDLFIVAYKEPESEYSHQNKPNLIIYQNIFLGLQKIQLKTKIEYLNLTSSIEIINAVKFKTNTVFLLIKVYSWENFKRYIEIELNRNIDKIRDQEGFDSDIDLNGSIGYILIDTKSNENLGSSFENFKLLRKFYEPHGYESLFLNQDSTFDVVYRETRSINGITGIKKLKINSNPNDDSFTNIFSEMKFFDRINLPSKLKVLDIKKVGTSDIMYALLTEVKEDDKTLSYIFIVQEISKSFGVTSEHHQIEIEVLNKIKTNLPHDEIEFCAFNDNLVMIEKLEDKWSIYSRNLYSKKVTRKEFKYVYPFNRLNLNSILKVKCVEEKSEFVVLATKKNQNNSNLFFYIFRFSFFNWL